MINKDLFPVGQGGFDYYLADPGWAWQGVSALGCGSAGPGSKR